MWDKPEIIINVSTVVWYFLRGKGQSFRRQRQHKDPHRTHQAAFEWWCEESPKTASKLIERRKRNYCTPSQAMSCLSLSNLRCTIVSRCSGKTSSALSMDSFRLSANCKGIPRLLMRSARVFEGITDTGSLSWQRCFLKASFSTSTRAGTSTSRRPYLRFFQMHSFRKSILSLVEL